MSEKFPKQKGFEYYRTREQILDYRKVPAEEKLKWLEEMWKFNKLVGESNPQIAKIQEMFRRGEI